MWSGYPKLLGLVFRVTLCSSEKEHSTDQRVVSVGFAVRRKVFSDGSFGDTKPVRGFLDRARVDVCAEGCILSSGGIEHLTRAHAAFLTISGSGLNPRRRQSEVRHMPSGSQLRQNAVIARSSASIRACPALRFLASKRAFVFAI